MASSSSQRPRPRQQQAEQENNNVIDVDNLVPNSTYAAIPQQGLNANQSPSDRRTVRTALRKLIAKQEKNADEATRANSALLKDLTQLSDYYYNNVGGTTEAALDAHVQKNLANLGSAKAANLNQDMRRYEGKEFIARLHAFMQRGEELDWLALGRMTSYYYRRSAGVSTMYGPLMVEEREKKVRQRAARDVVEAAIAPDVILDTAAEAPNQTMKRVVAVNKSLKRVCRRRESVEFYEFVINPKSFSQTIENIFHLSFSVKQGFAKLTVAPDGCLMVSPAKPTDRPERADGNLNATNQAVMSMSMAHWRRIVAELGLTEALIEPHEDVVTDEYLPPSVSQAVDNAAAAAEAPRSQARKKKRTQRADSTDDDDDDDDDAADTAALQDNDEQSADNGSRRQRRPKKRSAAQATAAAVDDN